MLACLGAGSACSQALGGVLADRAGRRRTMVLGLCSSAATLLAVGAATTLPALCATATLYGLCLNLLRPAVNAALADLVPDRDRPRAYALNFWAINLGFAVATPLGGFLAARGYWTLFLLDAATSLGFALLVLRGVPETRPAPHEDDVVGTLRDVLRDRLMLALVAGCALQAVVYLQAFSTLPLVFDQDGLSPGDYGLALGLNGVLIVVLQPLLLGLLAGRARGRLLLLAMVLQGAGFGLHGLAGTVGQHAGAVVVWTVGEVLQAGLLSAVVAGLAPVHLRGRYMGAFGVSFGVAGAIAPLAGTQVLAHAGQGALWGSCVVASLVSGVALMRVSDAAALRPAR
ncbi:MAG: major facilitator superfamily 1 [Frankiales bacterium]|nr:major facilitator superfamily 1 [Frankiales bacterium]